MPATFPSYEELVSILGVDPRDAEAAVTLEPAVLLDVVQLYLRNVEVDEEAYRRAYPDVAEALAEGGLDSGRQHFIEYGYYEGRSPQPESPES